MSRDLLYPARRLHGLARRVITKHRLRRDMQAQLAEKPAAVLLVMTPEHGNLGDHAIARAEIKLLEAAGLDYIEISGKKLALLKRHGLLNMLNGRGIMVNGGGNLGTLWPSVESTFRSLISENPDSRILLLPNTIYYEDSDWGRADFAESQKVYNAHKRLTLYAREKQSFDVMQAAYREVKLMPDMVLSLNGFDNSLKRSGCIICLRGDREKTLTDAQQESIWAEARRLFGDGVKASDTVLGKPVSADEREGELAKKFAEFSSAELVITDRLHGMIFCAITGTPCIVVNSRSPKVRGCYEWIKHLEYIRFADDTAAIAGAYGEMPVGPHEFDNGSLLHYYSELTDTLREFAD